MFFTFVLLFSSSFACEACLAWIRRQQLGFDAEDPENKFHLGRLIKHVAPLVLADDEVENRKINWGEIVKIAGQVNQIGQVLGYDAEDLDDKKIKFNPHKITEYAGKIHQIGQILGYDAEELNNFLPTDRPHKPWICYADPDDLENRKIKFNPHKITEYAGKIHQIGQILGYDAEDLVDMDDRLARIYEECAKRNAEMSKYPWYQPIVACPAPMPRVALKKATSSDADVEDRKINWGEIVKIAGQVNQIGQVLGYDAEDLDDKKINLDEIAKIAGQTQQIIQILKSDDDFENGLGKKLKKLGKRISKNIRRELPKVTDIAGKVAKVGEVLGYDVEDLDDKKIKFNPHKITEYAGKIHQIGQILGYDAEDLDDIAVTTACAIIGAVCALTNTGLKVYDTVKGADEAEDLDNWKISVGINGKF